MTEDEREKYRTPLWCPVCDLVMKGGPGGDDRTYFKWGCCRHCYVEFVEHREPRWEAGWRPTAEDIDRFIKNMRG